MDPVADAETIETELMLADLESVERRLQNLQRKIKGGDKDAKNQARLLELAKEALENGRPARTIEIDEEDERDWRILQLLTAKPVLRITSYNVCYTKLLRSSNPPFRSSSFNTTK